MPYPLSDVMDRSAALLNDAAKSSYTYDKQLPYLAIALDELQEVFELNDIPTNNEESGEIYIVAGNKVVGFNTAPKLPDNLVEIQQLWEKLPSDSTGYIPMTKMNFLPHYLDGQLTSQLVYWTWEHQQIKFIGANVDVVIKMDYISSIFPVSISKDTMIEQINVKTFLTYRNAALCAEFIGENPTRAQSLNNDAVMAMDRALGIPTKGKQSIAIRRKPFRAAYRSRSVVS